MTLNFDAYYWVSEANRINKQIEEAKLSKSNSNTTNYNNQTYSSNSNSFYNVMVDVKNSNNVLFDFDQVIRCLDQWLPETQIKQENEDQIFVDGYNACLNDIRNNLK
jgi:hypothetical protein